LWHSSSRVAVIHRVLGLSHACSPGILHASVSVSKDIETIVGPMTLMTRLVIRFCVRLLLAVGSAAALTGAVPASASALRLNQSMCHAVSSLAAADAKLPELRFTCTGEPERYQRASLWLRTDL